MNWSETEWGDFQKPYQQIAKKYQCELKSSLMAYAQCWENTGTEKVPTEAQVHLAIIKRIREIIEIFSCGKWNEMFDHYLPTREHKAQKMRSFFINSTASLDMKRQLSSTLAELLMESPNSTPEEHEQGPLSRLWIHWRIFILGTVHE